VILAHASSHGNEGKGQLNRDAEDGMPDAFQPSEAEAIIVAFRHLSPTDSQAILDFLRSL